MPNSNVQSELLAAVQGASAEDLPRLRAQMEQLTFIAGQQVLSLKDNTDAVTQNTVVHSSGNTATNVAKGVSQALGIGLFLSPLITGIAKLFGGGKSEASVPALTQFQKPASISVEAAIGQAGSAAYTGVDYGQSGTARRIAPQQQVTIQIQALDSQSLLDRSDDLARAVRQAMLQSSGLNSVISEL